MTTLLTAVARPRFLASVWLWRAIAYTATTALASGLLWLVLAVPLAPLVLAVLVVTTNQAAAAGLGLVGVGALAVVGPRLAVVVGAVERRRLRLVGDQNATAGRRSGRLYTDPATWRAVAYLLLLGVVVPVWLGVLTMVGLLVLSTPISVSYRLDHAGSVSALQRVVLGIALVPGLLYLTGAFGGGHAALARILLCSEDVDGRAARPGSRYQSTDAARTRAAGGGRGAGGGELPHGKRPHGKRRRRSGAVRAVRRAGRVRRRVGGARERREALRGRHGGGHRPPVGRPARRRGP